MRFAVAAVLSLTLAGASFAAQPLADGFPSGPITIIVAQAAGGAVEAGARVWQPFVEKELGVPLNFEFREGAAGQIGLTVLQESEADGYSLGVSNAVAVESSILLQTAPYKLEDFESLTITFNDVGILMAHKDEPYNTLSELIAYAKTLPPGELTVGVPSITDVNVVGLLQLEEATGVDFNIVSFNGGGKARTALAGHHIPLGAFMYFGSTTVAEETKLLGVNMDTTDIAALKDLETFNEIAGKKMDDIYSISNVYAPKGFRAAYPERYTFLIEAFRRAFASPELLAQLKALDQEGWLIGTIGQENCAPLDLDRAEFVRKNIELMKPKQ
jgi:tripartite-type tricarboxylate transporter receptor subunit TctC